MNTFICVHESKAFCFLAFSVDWLCLYVFTETVLLFLFPFIVGFCIEGKKINFWVYFTELALTLRYINLIFLWNLCGDLKGKAFYDNLNFLVFIIIIDIDKSCCFEVIGQCFDVKERLFCNVLPPIMLQKRHFMIIWTSWSFLIVIDIDISCCSKVIGKCLKVWWWRSIDNAAIMLLQ